MQIDAILFDKDGTIFDSERVCCDAWEQSANEFGYEFDREYFLNFVGLSAPESQKLVYAYFGADFPIQDFLQRARTLIHTEKAKGLPIKKGFDAFFTLAKTLNIPMAVVTSSNTESAEKSFAKTDYWQSLAFVITSDDVDHPKPNPQPYLRACKRIGAKPQHTLVFEDSNIGITAALAAACQTIAIPDLLPIQSKLAEQCLAVVESFDDAQKFLNKL
ncbi:HAD family hydrolase [Glaciecola petra]|uniref:HAD family phosphatase n=1 Tax=Glaciecola petra TaxID=3075602 RepID=A0ABU2ZX09_9ALTE|nr:HAD family phosphatase [Aestuariibacter sp. P117]MDT0596119.1 HAD family phosphatase [Aestuariibacter sp. P117]